MTYQKIGIFLGVMFVLYFLAAGYPVTAGLVHDMVAGVGDAVGGLAEYIRRLVR